MKDFFDPDASTEADDAEQAAEAAAAKDESAGAGSRRRRSLERRRHTFHSAEGAHPHSKANIKAVQRVALEMAEPVSPTSMEAAERQLEKMRSRGSMTHCSVPCHRASDPGTEGFEMLHMKKDLALTTFSVCEESPYITSPCSAGDAEPSSIQDAWDSLNNSPTRQSMMDAFSPFASPTASHSPLLGGGGTSNSPPCLWRSISEQPRPDIRFSSFDEGIERPQARASADSDSSRTLRRSISTPYRRFTDSTCSSQRVQREVYVRTEDFRNRRLTDSDCVTNLQPVPDAAELYARSSQESEFGIIAKELGLLLPPSMTGREDHRLRSHSFNGQSSCPVSTLNSANCKDASKSPRNLHPAVKLRKLRSNNSYYFDEARPIMPLGPVPATDKYWTTRGRQLRTLRSMAGRTSDGCSRGQSHSPTSVLSRRSSATSRGSECDRPRHRMSEPGMSRSPFHSSFEVSLMQERMALAADRFVCAMNRLEAEENAEA